MFKICAVTHVGLHVKCPLFMFGMYGQILVKYPDIKYHENRFRGSRIS
jgi:hypothetical protein